MDEMVYGRAAMMTQSKKVDKIVRALDTIFRREIEQELHSGYRGYHLHDVGVCRKISTTEIKYLLSMYMHNSPLHPNDVIYVGGDVPRDADIRMIAANAVLSIKRLIDTAYSKPSEVRITNGPLI